ncbi:hypothetical protein JX266_000777 [Neoarthrinium moseri]|nr:hypothetical protein JX266_000777 [Neoarthrinium moseri]
MYSPPHFTFDNDYPSQYSMPAIFGDTSTANYLGLQHDLAGNGWSSNQGMSCLPDAAPGNPRVSPAGTAYSSFSSSGASDAMASMSLDTPMLNHARPSDMIISCPSTVSPKVLRINPSPAPTSSSESVHAALYSASDSQLSSSSSFDQSYLPTVPTSSSKRLNAKGRKQLPDKPRKSSNTDVPAPSARSRGSSRQNQPAEQQALTCHPKSLAEIKPKPARSAVVESPAAELPPQAIERNKKDKFLVDSKLAGMTYKEIRRKGGFTEAESTLRGRFRTLTKNKEARVRKPEWTDTDIRLLKKAVRKFAKGEDVTPSKIPWKQVSEYITTHGGSYQFGNATCRRRWDELVDQGE